MSCEFFTRLKGLLSRFWLWYSNVKPLLPGTPRALNHFRRYKLDSLYNLQKFYLQYY